MKYLRYSLFVLFFGLLSMSPAQYATAHVASAPTLEEKVGEMLIVGFRGTYVTKKSPIVTAINDLNLGGVVLFDYDMPSKSRKRNIVGKSELKSLVSNLERYTSKHLFVSVDLEGGAVNRLKSRYGFKDFPSAESLGRKGNLFTTERIGREIGTQLSEYGFNMDFAPSVDLNVNDDNPIIGAVGRSFSSNPEIVSLHANAFMKGLRSKNIVSVIKHFPGHGSSTTDSHLGFVDVTNTYKEEELLPFKALAKTADAVMVAHVTNTNIDPDHPATLSKTFIQNILRNDLGFEGVVISDDMSMGAIVENYTLENAVVLAINAGNDILVVSNNGSLPYDELLPYTVSKIIVDAVNDGRIDIATIDSAYERIQKLKAEFKI